MWAKSPISCCWPGCSTSTTPSLSPPNDLSGTLGQVRDLSKQYLAGDESAFAAFRELVSLLLHSTILDPSGTVRLAYGQGPNPVLGGWSGPTDPLRLTSGNFLRLSVGLYREEATEGPRVKVSTSSFQYQLDATGDQWVFRYDYLRTPPDPHPASHLQIRGSLTHVPEIQMKDVHFPTHRVSLEAVIRLLIEEFRVPPRRESEFWRAVLAESEAVFMKIHHRSLSGPDE